MPTEEHRKQALRNYVDSINAGDVDGVVGLFAQDARVEDPVGKPAMEGHEAIRAFFGQSVGQIQITADLPRAAHDDRFASVPLVIDAGTLLIRAVDVMEFDEDGKIVRMWAYWGSSDVERASED